MSILTNIKSFPRQFWLLNSIQTIERLAYWITLLQMPVYIAQKDLAGGLHWEQAIKGIIFFWWALIQNISPVLSGGFSDRFGRKKVMFVSSIMIIIGFILVGNFKTFAPFLISTMILGLGMGVFKPSLQGAVSGNISGGNSAFGWGIYTTFVNIAYFIGPSCSIFLKGIAWDWVFYGSAVVQCVNLILIFFIKDDVVAKNVLTSQKQTTVLQLFSDSIKLMIDSVRGIFKPEVIIFLILATGFTLNHMQFYETLPNYVLDWSDTSGLVKYSPDFMQKTSPRGTMIAFEWIYNINSTMLVLFVALSAFLTRKRNLIKMCGLGILLVSIGLFTAGFTTSGWYLVLGVFILGFGEILITPRIHEYFSSIAPPESKSQYLGYAALAWMFGLAGGGIVGGYLYQHLGEKSSFAIKYLAEHFHLQASSTDAIATLCQKTGLSEIGVTDLLWNTYHPWHFWLPFISFGVLAAIGMFIYGQIKSKHNK
jgi:MFS family permease